MSKGTVEGGGVSAQRGFSFLSNLFGRQSDPAADLTMLKFFLSSLEVRATSIGMRVQNDADKKALVDEVSGHLAGVLRAHVSMRSEDMWNKAYMLKRKLSLAEPSDTLVREVQRRIEEATEDKVPAAEKLNKMFDDVSKEIVAKGMMTSESELNLRAILYDTLDKHRWVMQMKSCIRSLQRNASNRIVVAEISAFLLLVAPLIWLYIKELIFHSSPSFEYWASLPLYMTLAAGLFGAFFSRMLTLLKNWDILSLTQVRDAMDWRAIILRGSVGMSGALIVYFLLQSRLIGEAGLSGGLMFPKFSEIGFIENWYPIAIDGASVAKFSIHLFQPSAALALLVIWSFFAGFSERLVPGILDTTEASLRESADRHRAQFFQEKLFEDRR